MGTKIYGGLTWVGDSGSPKGNFSRSLITKVLTEARLATFATNIKTQSDCNVAYTHHLKDISVTPSAPSMSADVSRVAIIYFRDDTNLKVYHFSFPAPKSSILEITPAGKRIKQSSVIGIVAQIAFVADTEYTALYGVYVDRV